jgi:hypothetical protein
MRRRSRNGSGTERRAIRIKWIEGTEIKQIRRYSPEHNIHDRSQDLRTRVGVMGSSVSGT